MNKNAATFSWRIDRRQRLGAGGGGGAGEGWIRGDSGEGGVCRI